MKLSTAIQSAFMAVAVLLAFSYYPINNLRRRNAFGFNLSVGNANLLRNRYQSHVSGKRIEFSFPAAGIKNISRRLPCRNDGRFSGNVQRTKRNACFSTVGEELKKIADRSPQEMIRRFVEIGEQLANGRPLGDDVTFVILKIKDDYKGYS